MVGYLLRTVPVLVRARLARRPALESRIHGVVSLGQIDLNLHLNQAVYAQVFELGRADWIVRSGAWAAWRADGVNPVVAEQRLVYRRELRRGQRWSLDTRATGVEGRLLAVQGHLLVGDRVHATCEAKLIFVGRDGVLAPEAVARACRPFLARPLEVHDWRVADR